MRRCDRVTFREGAGRAGVRPRRAGLLRLRRCAHRVSPWSFEAAASRDGGTGVPHAAIPTVEASDSVDRSCLSRRGPACVVDRAGRGSRIVHASPAASHREHVGHAPALPRNPAMKAVNNARPSGHSANPASVFRWPRGPSSNGVAPRACAHAMPRPAGSYPSSELAIASTGSWRNRPPAHPRTHGPQPENAGRPNQAPPRATHRARRASTPPASARTAGTQRMTDHHRRRRGLRNGFIERRHPVAQVGRIP